ncbi:MAG: hypothetical protein R6V05_15395 [Candidatus Brocadiia bacterium]
MDPSESRYWRFYWPLALMGVVALSGRLAQNYALMAYPEGSARLAAYALAIALVGPFRAALVFVPQMSNVMVRGPRSMRSSFRHLLAVCGVLTLPVALLGWTPLGRLLVPMIYNVGSRQVGHMVSYLRWLTLLVAFFGMGRYFTGLLVQARRTGLITVLRVLHLAVLVGTLMVGRRLGWSPVTTISLSIIVPEGLLAALSALGTALLHEHRRPEEDRAIPLGEMARFFLPMAGTAILFAFTRPIIYAFLTALPGSADRPVEAMVAAVALASTFTMVFQGAVNQFRNLFATFGRQDPRGVSRFMVRVAGGLTVLMVIAVVTPAARLFFRYLQNARAETLAMATQAVLPLCLVPLIICWRNYNHGLAMVRRRTGLMFAGGIMRNVSVLVCAALLAAAGGYNHVTAAAMLPVAFGAEALTGTIYRKLRHPEDA